MGGRAGRLTPSEARQAAAVGLPATRPIRAGAHQDEIIEILLPHRLCNRGAEGPRHKIATLVRHGLQQFMQDVRSPKGSVWHQINLFAGTAYCTLYVQSNFLYTK